MRVANVQRLKAILATVFLIESVLVAACGDNTTVLQTPTSSPQTPLIPVNNGVTATSSSSALSVSPVPPIVAPGGVVDKAVATTGCNKIPTITAGAQVALTLSSSGLTRSYFLHLPKSYQPAKSYPLVLFFHSASREYNPDNLALEINGVGLSPLADQANFIVAYPVSTTGSIGFRWNTGLAYEPQSDDLGFVNELLNQLQVNYCIENQRIYATGFSSGGGMVGLLACKMANRFAAFAPVAGFFARATYQNCQPSRPVPIMEFHGTADSKVDYRGMNGSQPAETLPIVQWLEDWARRDKCTNGPQTFFTQGQVVGERWTGCQGNTSVVHYRIVDGEHDWPGANFVKGGKGAGGGATPDFEATALIWQFFQTHPLS